MMGGVAKAIEYRGCAHREWRVRDMDHQKVRKKSLWFAYFLNMELSCIWDIRIPPNAYLHFFEITGKKV